MRQSDNNAAKPWKRNAHVDEGISHLGEAVDHGKQGHGEVAGEHSQEALKHLQQGY